MSRATPRTIEFSVTGKVAFAIAALSVPPFLLAGCGPSYSPDTYSGNAVQQANKVDQGVVVGVRAIAISADSTVATATGGAAGGIAGSQAGGNTVSALGALGGSVAGGLVGNVVGHAAGDTNGFEYIVRKPNGDLLSVTQKDISALKIGQHVLIIEGPQARIVPDYTVAIEPATPHPPEGPPASPKDSGPKRPDDAAAATQPAAPGDGQTPGNAPLEAKAPAPPTVPAAPPESGHTPNLPPPPAQAPANAPPGAVTPANTPPSGTATP